MFLLWIVGTVALAPSSLLADDQSSQRPFGGEPSPADSGSSVKWGQCDSNDSAAQPRAVRLEALFGSKMVPASTKNEDATEPLFSHRKWEGPAAVLSRPPAAQLQWKGAFRTGRPSPAKIDPSVVQTSVASPPSSVQFVSLPTTAPVLQPPGELSRPARLTEPTKDVAQPSFESQLDAPQKLTEKCISPRDLRPINKITADISVKPEDLVGNKRLPPECSLGDVSFQPRHWHTTTFAWTAASSCHNPIYFDDEQLERYGHSWGPVKQTAVSAVKFFATVPLVPYFMGVNPPNECIYELGQFRPGSCAPYYLDPLPLSVRGALYEGMFLGVLPAL
jgi:hypothetical protein